MTGTCKKCDCDLPKKSGPKPMQPTDEERKQVEAMAGYGVPMEQIATLIRGGISVKTLASHFHEDLMRGKAKANAQIGRMLFQKAINGDTTAAIFWAKTQMRWNEVHKHELTGADGGPIEFDKIERVIISGNAENTNS